MSPRSLRLLETALVSAFVSFGVSAVVLHGMAPPSTSDPVDDPFLRVAMEADAELSAADSIDEVAAHRVAALYEGYLEQSDQRATLGDFEWARGRVERLRQLEADLETMRALEAEAKALEQAQHDSRTVQSAEDPLLGL